MIKSANEQVIINDYRLITKPTKVEQTFAELSHTRIMYVI